MLISLAHLMMDDRGGGQQYFSLDIHHIPTITLILRFVHEPHDVTLNLLNASRTNKTLSSSGIVRFAQRKTDAVVGLQAN